jgi:Ca-activated chloride channel family protein
MSTELLPLIAAEPAGPPVPGRPTCGELSSSTGERLPLKALSVEAAIVGLTATATVRQRFVNTGDSAIEATYVFPLPARAGVTDFEACLAGRRVIGELKERGRAREDYEQALVAGQRAAIVEEDRSDVFSVRVGNLGPGEEAVIEMRLTGPLAFEDGEATFRFPLVVAPRYTTGSPLPGDQTGAGVGWDTDAVPDASRVTPPRLAADDERPELEVSLTLQGGGLAVSGVRASLPTAVLEGSADAPTLLRVEPGARADRDFVLRFAVDRIELSSCALLVPDAGDDPAEGTWSVTLLPPAETSSAPRDVVLLLDRSGSMDGWKMVAARRAAGRIVDMLEPADRFCVLAFDDRIDTPPAMPAGLVEASDRNRFAAASWLGSLESRGGTEMADPLHRAVQMLAGSGQERMASVVLVTDGQISGEDHLLRTLAPLIGRTRSYCVGIDRAVNAGFLERLAGLGNGRVELVESEERLDEAMARLARTIGRPSLTAIEISGDGIELIGGTRTPGRSPDAFAGVPCVISGRYRGRLADSAAFRVDAGGAAGPFTTVVPARVAPDAVAVRAIWARSVVRDLEDAYASGLGDSELSSRLVAHSVRFGVLSRFTAFVAIDPERTEAGPLNEVVQPVDTPSGWAPASYSMAAPAGMMAAPMGAAPMMPVAEAMPSSGARTAPAAMAPRAAMPAPVPVPVPAPPRPPRPLKKLLKEAEKATQVRRTGVDGVVAELTQHRMSTGDPALRAALDRLCDALSRFLRTPGPALAREVMVAVETVKRAAAGADHGQPTARRRFWQ